MKQLQNNFTTTEQSKWLLELGVPANSADCIVYESTNNVYVVPETIDWSGVRPFLPCWSVGRLIEIAILCTQHYTGSDVVQFQRNSIEYGLIECLIALLQISKDDGDLDFTKLED